jgi:hypothetical protein
VKVVYVALGIMSRADLDMFVPPASVTASVQVQHGTMFEQFCADLYAACTRGL